MENNSNFHSQHGKSANNKPVVTNSHIQNTGTGASSQEKLAHHSNQPYVNQAMNAMSNQQGQIQNSNGMHQQQQGHTQNAHRMPSQQQGYAQTASRMPNQQSGLEHNPSYMHAQQSSRVQNSTSSMQQPQRSFEQNPSHIPSQQPSRVPNSTSMQQPQRSFDQSPSRMSSQQQSRVQNSTSMQQPQKSFDQSPSRMSSQQGGYGQNQSYMDSQQQSRVQNSTSMQQPQKSFDQSPSRMSSQQNGYGQNQSYMASQQLGQVQNPTSMQQQQQSFDQSASCMSNQQSNYGQNSSYMDSLQSSQVQNSTSMQQQQQSFDQSASRMPNQQNNYGPNPSYMASQQPSQVQNSISMQQQQQSFDQSPSRMPSQQNGYGQNQSYMASQQLGQVQNPTSMQQQQQSFDQNTSYINSQQQSQARNYTGMAQQQSNEQNQYNLSNSQYGNEPPIDNNRPGSFSKAPFYDDSISQDTAYQNQNNALNSQNFDFESQQANSKNETAFINNTNSAPSGINAYRTPDLSYKSKSSKKVIVASQRGRSHARSATPRDDDFSVRYDPNNGWIVIALADGCGSAKYSREGSKVVCEHLKTILGSKLNLESQMLDDSIMEYIFGTDENKKKAAISTINSELFKLIGDASLSSRNKLAEHANKHNCKLGDFATTLLLTICKRFIDTWFIATFSIGDGVIALYKKESLDKFKTNEPDPDILILNYSDSGNFAGETKFITSDDIFGLSEFYSRFKLTIAKDFKALFIMTDGVSDPFFDTEAQMNDPKAWDDFYNNLKQENVLEDEPLVASQNLLKWLSFMKEGYHDDRTIAIIY